MEKLKFNKDVSPAEIIENLRQKAFDPNHFGSLDGYLEFLGHSLWKFQKIGIQVPTGSDNYKCCSVVDQLVNHGYIELI